MSSKMSEMECRLQWYVTCDEVRRNESAIRDRLMAEYKAEGYSEEAAYCLAMVEIDPHWGDVPF